MTSRRAAARVPVLLVGVLLLVAAVVGGCATGGQREPDTVAPSTGTPSASARTPEPGSALVTVYFLRDQRLVEAQRRGPRTAQAALDLLTAGPTPEEVTTGIDSAVAPQSIVLDPRTPDAGTAVVTVGAEFTALTGRRQLLAAGQVVWTVTAAPGVDRVRLLLDGRPLATPTDRGLTRSAVGRSDFGSMSPATPPAPRPDGPPG